MSCLLFHDFLIISPGSPWMLTATRLPADFYIRVSEEWIIKGSHLEIMKRSKMPMLIALGAVGITGRCYCSFFKHYCVRWEMRSARVRYTRIIPLGHQGHENKLVISAKHDTGHNNHIQCEPFMDGHTNPKGHSTGSIFTHLTHTHTHTHRRHHEDLLSVICIYFS